jgi:hypothetical protein
VSSMRKFLLAAVVFGLPAAAFVSAPALAATIHPKVSHHHVVHHVSVHHVVHHAAIHHVSAHHVVHKVVHHTTS